MEQLVADLFGDAAVLADISAYDVIFAFAASVILNGILARLYIFTHGGYSYSKSYNRDICILSFIINRLEIVSHNFHTVRMQNVVCVPLSLLLEMSSNPLKTLGSSPYPIMRLSHQNR